MGDDVISRNLLAFCRKFVADNEITCAETVYQTDSVIEHAYEFIEGVCEIVGYFDREALDRLSPNLEGEK